MTHQIEQMELKWNTFETIFDPTSWSDNMNINVGLGAPNMDLKHETD